VLNLLTHIVVIVTVHVTYLPREVGIGHCRKVAVLPKCEISSRTLLCRSNLGSPYTWKVRESALVFKYHLGTFPRDIPIYLRRDLRVVPWTGHCAAGDFELQDSAIGASSILSSRTKTVEIPSLTTQHDDTGAIQVLFPVAAGDPIPAAQRRRLLGAYHFDFRLVRGGMY
jgi:hypothetical protein